MIVSARCNFRWSRRFSASSCVTRGSTGRGIGPRRRPRISRSAPASRCRRQFVSSDEYNPSRRNRAPTSPGFLHASTSLEDAEPIRGGEAPPLDRRRHLRVRGGRAGRGHGAGTSCRPARAPFAPGPATTSISTASGMRVISPTLLAPTLISPRRLSHRLLAQGGRRTDAPSTRRTQRLNTTRRAHTARAIPAEQLSARGPLPVPPPAPDTVRSSR